MISIPLLRRGDPYYSLDVTNVCHHVTGEPFVNISQANVGLIRRDLLKQQDSRAHLRQFSTKDLLRMCELASDLFANSSLPLGDLQQTPDDYVHQVSATTGLPLVMARRNLRKISGVMAQMEKVVNGITRHLSFEILDRGFGDFNGTALSYFPRTESLGIVLPSNSPGVHSLWIPSIPLKIPLILKPGSSEPWTPYRIAQAFIKAGCPAEAFSYYPTDHAGGAEILRQCGRGMLFGDTSSTGIWKDDSRVEVHGPGYSKIIIGLDCIEDWEQYLDVIVASIVENGGRSCVNASGVWVPKYASQIAEALAIRLAKIVPKSADDDDAMLAPFVNPKMAEKISQRIDQELARPGARDVTASYRPLDRLVCWQGCHYLLPTVVLCKSSEHPLANREYLFPFASVVDVNQDMIPEALGTTLVVTAITRDPELIQRLITSPLVDRLNIGAIPTFQVAWDQPHEGNLFEHLYSRRAFQTPVEAA